MTTRPALSTPALVAMLTLAMLLLAGVARAQGVPPDADDLSTTQTGYIGARLLGGGEHVLVEGIEQGRYPDGDEQRDRYLFWEGDSLFAGVIDEATNNKVDLVAEFYWFESSIPRNSDFYVVVLKVSSTPQPGTNWRIATPGNLLDDVLFRNIGPAQNVVARVDRSGAAGAIRWDWSVPFQSYRWEPERVIEVSQDYNAGTNVEGGAMRSLTEGVSIQAKGSASAKFRVSTRYTITLWRWAMMVSAGATDMEWQLTALDPEHTGDAAYHEYFLVMQSERGVPVRINSLNIGATLRDHRLLLPDRFMDLSAAITGITIDPPSVDARGLGECPEGSRDLDGECVADCPLGFRYDGQGGCVDLCETGRRWDGGACIQDCADGERAWRDGCVPECEKGYVEAGQTCVVHCEAGAVPDDTGELCVPDCPSGTHAQGDRCVDGADPDALRCGRGTHEEDGACVADEVKPAGPGPQQSPADEASREGFDPEGRCATHDECPFGSHCRAGMCASECLSPEDCSAGQICNARAMCVDASFVGKPQASVSEDGDGSGGCATLPVRASAAAPSSLLGALLGRR